MTDRSAVRVFLKFCFLGLLALLLFLPIAFVFGGSFFGKAELVEKLAPVSGYTSWRLFPAFPTLRQYVELLLDSPAFFVMFWNTVKITVITIVGQLVVATTGAWWLAVNNSKKLFNVYVLLMIMPFQVTMVSNYLVLDKIKLLDSHWGIILPLIFSTFPVFIIYRFFASIPKDILEAGKIDGANQLEIFLLIGVPLAKGGIVSAMLLSFIDCWGLLEQPMIFLKTQRLWVLSQFLPSLSTEKFGIAMVSSVMVIIPAILIFLLGQEYLEQGISHSGSKE